FGELYSRVTEVARAKARRDLNIIEKHVRRGRVLDVGCGHGDFLAEAKSRGWEVAGIELNYAASVYASQKVGVTVMPCKLTSASFPPEAFDVVTMFGVLEHTIQPMLELKEIYRVLKVGGLAVIDVPSENGLYRRTGQALYRVSRGRADF